MMKKIISTIAGSGLLLLTAMPAFAASQFGCQNLTTGFNSNNTCNTIMSKFKLLGLSNFGSASHFVAKNVTTGNNGVMNNTSTATNPAVNSGNADATLFSGASVNTANVTTTQNESAADLIGTNSVTGSTSNNAVNVTNTKTAIVGLENFGSALHFVGIEVVTGSNLVQNNTVIGGGVMTGNGTANTTVQSGVNDMVISTNQ